MWKLVLLLIIGAVVAGCTQAEEPPDDVQPDVGWQELPASPLTPRTGAHAFWTGSSVLVIGGSDDVRCPPNADCVDREPSLSDGAAYHPQTDTWTELPEAPVPLGYPTGGVVGETLYVWVPGLEVGARPAFLSYTPGDEAWVELDPPPIGQGSFVNLIATGDRLVAYHGSQELGVAPDLAYDPLTDTWTELPLDPLAPAFGRQVVWADGALILFGNELVPNPGSEEPAVVLAARLDLEDGTWQRYPDSEVLGGPWQWTGDRLVNPAIGGADGGQANNWGRFYPNGGVLNPARGEWSELPHPPGGPGEFGGFTAAGDGWAVSADGWALHVASGTWVELRRPAAGAAETGQAAVWADDRLFVLGGSRIVNERFELVGGGWSWVPPRQ